MAKVHQVSDEFVYFRKTIEEMRKRSQELMQDGRNIQSHFSRMIREYGDWEDRLKELDEQVNKLASETGLTPKEIHSEIAIPQVTSDSILDDLFEEEPTSVTSTPKDSLLDDLLNM